MVICYFCHPSTLSSATVPVHMTSVGLNLTLQTDSVPLFRPVSLCCHPEIYCIFKMSLPNAFSIAHSLPNFTVSIYFFHCTFQVFFFCAGQLFFLPFSSCLVFILPLKGVAVFFFSRFFFFKKLGPVLINIGAKSFVIGAILKLPFLYSTSLSGFASAFTL